MYKLRDTNSSHFNLHLKSTVKTVWDTYYSRYVLN